MSPTLLALLGFTCWALALLGLIVVTRTTLVLTGKHAVNSFDPGHSDLSPFLQRLARAHANCLEGLPIFGGLMIVAILAGKSGVTDPLAMLLVGARIVQSTIHLVSTSPLAVYARFSAFSVQVGIAIYWAFRLHAA
jgi:uncharacterized MAPEG superfamily protein